MQRLPDAFFDVRGPQLLSRDGNPSCWPAADAVEFGRFRVLLRQRQLLADGVPINLGTRAFDVLVALLEAEGGLVTKDQLLSRGWPGITVVEDNLKVQICALRTALGEDRDFIRTECGRGYRFIAPIRRSVPARACQSSTRWWNCRAERPAVRWIFRQPPHTRAARAHRATGGDPAH